MGATAVVERMIPTVPPQTSLFMAALTRRTPVLVRAWARARQKRRPHHHLRRHHPQRQLPLHHHLHFFRIVGPVTRAFTTAMMGATANVESGTLTAKTTNRICTTAGQPRQNLLLIIYASFQTAPARVNSFRRLHTSKTPISSISTGISVQMALTLLRRGTLASRGREFTFELTMMA